MEIISINLVTFKRNILASYASQIYVTTAGIVMVPLYIQYMGAEAYGLVGFFAMLQAWFNLLDMGLSPTMSRESARFNGGAISALEYRLLSRALEGLFAGIALMGGVLLFVLAEPIANRWLNVNALSISETVNCLRLMAVIVSLRWVCGFYRGVITGAEQLVWLSGLNSAIATLRYILIVPILLFISAAPLGFFVFQLFVTVVELGTLAWAAYRILPPILVEQRIQWQWAPVKPVLKFALSIAFTSAVWVLVTQTDKLVLSKILPLEDYGYFTVAVLLAGGSMMVSGPISGPIMPRMARLQAEGRHDDLIALYRRATHMVVVVALPVALVLAFFAPQVLWALTGDYVLVHKAAPALTLYATGYGFLAVGAFPYYLQFAKGDLKLHLLGNALFVVILIPYVIWAANKYGMVGAGWAWLTLNFVYLIAWTPLVHHRFAPGIHKKWLLIDIFGTIAPALMVASIASYRMIWSSQRVVLIVQIAALGIFLIFLTFSFLFVIKKIRNKFNFID